MTWAKISDTFNDHPVLLGLPRGVRLLHVEGVVWSCKQETDGVIPTGALPRFTDEPEFAAAAQQLVDAGMWTATDTGWLVVDFAKDQRLKVDIDADRKSAAARKERSRMHLAGDHSACTRGTYCPNGAIEPVGVSHRDGRRPSQPTSRPTSQPPDPTRPASKRDGEGTALRAVASAPHHVPMRSKVTVSR